MAVRAGTDGTGGHPRTRLSGRSGVSHCRGRRVEGTSHAVDPLYARSRDVLGERCEAAVERIVEELDGKRDLFEWGFYGDLPTRERYLRAAANRFLADFGQHPDRYVAAALPDLPFGTNEFPLVLSAHLLFLYGDRLDRAFHVAAARELARVASREVRLFPLAGLDTEISPHVGPVAAALRRDGLRVERVTVPFEFQRGADEMLVVRDTGEYRPRNR